MLQDGYKLSPLDEYTCPDEGSLDEVLKQCVRHLATQTYTEKKGMKMNGSWVQIDQSTLSQSFTMKQFLHSLVATAP